MVIFLNFLTLFKCAILESEIHNLCLKQNAKLCFFLLRCLKMEFVNFFTILESKAGMWKIYFKISPSFFFSQTPLWTKLGTCCGGNKRHQHASHPNRSFCLGPLNHTLVDFMGHLL